MIETGCATPIAYATWTSQRLAMPGGDDVLGDVAHRVRGRAVDLRRVLAAERAAAVAGHAAVGVDDDLAAGEAAVGVRAAELEVAGRVARGSSKSSSANCSGSSGRMTCSVRSGLIIVVDVDARAVLGRDEHGREPLRLAVDVLDRDLGLAVGPQVRRATPALRTSESRSASRCASQIGIGIRSSVSSQA